MVGGKQLNNQIDFVAIEEMLYQRKMDEIRELREAAIIQRKIYDMWMNLGEKFNASVCEEKAIRYDREADEKESKLAECES